jgi:hypothetical protein
MIIYRKDTTLLNTLTDYLLHILELSIDYEMIMRYV